MILCKWWDKASGGGSCVAADLRSCSMIYQAMSDALVDVRFTALGANGLPLILGRWRCIDEADGTTTDEELRRAVRGWVASRGLVSPTAAEWEAHVEKCRRGEVSA